MDGLADKKICVDGWKNGRVDRWMNSQKAAFSQSNADIDGRLWMDGQTDDQTKGRTDALSDGKTRTPVEYY